MEVFEGFVLARLMNSRKSQQVLKMGQSSRKLTYRKSKTRLK